MIALRKRIHGLPLALAALIFVGVCFAATACNNDQQIRDRHEQALEDED